jgi:hypothetical protein
MTRDLDRRSPLASPRWGVLALASAVVLTVVLSSLVPALAAADSEEDPPMAVASFQQMFELSKSQKKGLTLFVQGQTIAGLVVSFSDQAVEMRSQQYERIVVRIDRIDGIAYQ